MVFYLVDLIMCFLMISSVVMTCSRLLSMSAVDFPITIMIIFLIGAIHCNESLIESSFLLFNNTSSLFFIIIPPTILYEYFIMDRSNLMSNNKIALSALVAISSVFAQVCLVFLLCHELLKNYVSWDGKFMLIFVLMCVLPSSASFLSDFKAISLKPHPILKILQVEVLSSIMIGTVIIMWFDDVNGSFFSLDFEENELFCGGFWNFLLKLLYSVAVFIASLFLSLILQWYIRLSLGDAIGTSIFLILFGFALYDGINYLYVSAFMKILIVFLYACVTCPSQVSTNYETDQYVFFCLNFIHSTVKTFLCLHAAAVIAINSEHFTLLTIGCVFVGYFLSILARLLVYALMVPCLVSSPISSFDFVITCALLPEKSIMTILLATYSVHFNFKKGQELMTCGIILVITSFILQLAAKVLILKYSSFVTPGVMGKFSYKRVYNLLGVLSDSILAGLKCDLALSNSGWAALKTLKNNNIINLLTNKSIMMENHEFKIDKQVCSFFSLPMDLVELVELSNVERKRHLTEERLKVLCCQIHYCTILYWEGFITKEEFGVVISMVVNGLEKDSHKIDLEELNGFFGITFMICVWVVTFVNYFLNCFPQKNKENDKRKKKDGEKPAAFENPFLSGEQYKLTFRVFTLIDILIIMVLLIDMLLNDTPNPIYILSQKLLLVISTLLYFLFILEFFFSFAVFDASQYFISISRRVEFIAVWVVKSLDFFIMAHLYICKIGEVSDLIVFNDLAVHYKFYKGMVILMRFHRCLLLIEILCTKIKELFVRLLRKFLNNAILICLAYSIVLNKTIFILHNIISDMDTYTTLRKEIEADRKNIKRQLGN